MSKNAIQNQQGAENVSGIQVALKKKKRQEGTVVYKTEHLKKKEK